MDQSIRRFLAYLKLEKRYSPHTLTSYQNDLRQFEDFLKDYFQSDKVFWRLIDKKVLRLFLVHLQELNLSRRTAARKLAAVKSLFKYLASTGLMETNPASAIKMPRFDKKLPEYLTIDEVEKILSLPKVKTFKGLRDLAILELFYGTGLRLSELIGLKVSDVHFDEDIIRVMGKGQKERIVPLGKIAKSILKKYLQIRPHYAENNVDNVFVLKSGKAMYAMAVQRIIRNYMNQVSSVKQKSPHTLRHSYATHLLNSGAGIRVVKDLLGHASLSTTQIYTHISIDHLKKIYKQAHPGATEKHSSKGRRSR